MEHWPEKLIQSSGDKMYVSSSAIEDMRGMRSLDWSYNKIARYMGVSRDVVRYHVNKQRRESVKTLALKIKYEQR